MTRDEVQKLLGGYATGTLTPEEQQVLFAAALEDQEIFDALAREQGLRDLLRDPAAKAGLLAALDGPPRRGMFDWLRRPMVAGLAMAGLAAIGVAVWQGSRHGQLPTAATEERKVIAELKAPAPPPTAPTPVPGAEPAASPLARDDKASVPRPTPAAQPASPQGTLDKQVLVAEAKPRQQTAAEVGQTLEKDQKERVEITAAAPAAPPARQAEQTLNLQTQNQTQAAPAPQVNQAFQNQAFQNQAFQNKAASETVEVKAIEQSSPNARALFYGAEMPINGRSAFADSIAPAAGGIGGPKVEASEKRAEKKAATLAAGIGGAFATHIGLRCSIVRDGNREAHLSTFLNAGESVKLRLTPNADGMIYISETEGAGTRVIASGPVRRLRPFETPALKSDTPGQRQFQVTLIRGGMEKSAVAGFGAVSRTNLVETSADGEPATYMVQSDAVPGSQQFTAPITLTWR
jgi:hypothetical protein